MRILIRSKSLHVTWTHIRYTSRIDSRTTLRNDEIQISRKTILSRAKDAARRTLLRQVLRLSTTPLLLLFSNLTRLLPILLLQNLGSIVILLASIAMIFLLHHVTGTSLSATHTGISLPLPSTLNSTTAGTKAPLQGQISQYHTLKMLCP